MKTQLSKPAHSRARYTEEYKKEALELWRASGEPYTQRHAVTASMSKLASAQPAASIQ